MLSTDIIDFFRFLSPQLSHSECCVFIHSVQADTLKCANTLYCLFSNLSFLLTATEDLTSFKPPNSVVKATTTENRRSCEIAGMKIFFIISAQQLNRNHVIHTNRMKSQMSSEMKNWRL